MARLLAPILGIIASSSLCALCRSSTVRKPAFVKARALARVNPLRCHAFEASQYSSKEEGLRRIGHPPQPIPRRFMQARQPALHGGADSPTLLVRDRRKALRVGTL